MQWTYRKTDRSSARVELNPSGIFSDCYIIIEGNKKNGYSCASYPRIINPVAVFLFDVYANSLKDAAEIAVSVWKDLVREKMEEYLSAVIEE